MLADFLVQTSFCGKEALQGKISPEKLGKLLKLATFGKLSDSDLFEPVLLDMNESSVMSSRGRLRKMRMGQVFPI